MYKLIYHHPHKQKTPLRINKAPIRLWDWPKSTNENPD